MAESSVTTQKFTMRHFWIVATCVMCTFGPAAITFSCPGLCYKPVAAELGLQVSNVSFYMTCVYLAEVVFSAPVGWLLKKFDMRVICTIAALCVSIGVGMMSTYHEIWQWYVSGVFMGFGEITLLWLMVAGLLNRWFKKKLGLVIGLSYAMTGLGGACFNLIGQFILGADLSGWRNLYLFFGFAAAICSLPFTIFAIKSHPESVGLRAYGAEVKVGEEITEEAVADLPGVEAKVAYKKWFFYALIIAGCMANIGGIFPQHFTTFYQGYVALAGHTGDKIPELMILSGTLEAFTMVGMAIGKVSIGALESKNVFIALFFGVTVGFIGLCCIWWGGENVVLPVMWGGGLLYGFIYPFVTTLLPYVTRMLFGEKDYDRIYSVVLIPVNLVGAFAASGLALIYQGPGGWPAFFITGLISIIIILVCFLIAMAGTKFYRGKAFMATLDDAE